jgi:hypothetical protein
MSTEHGTGLLMPGGSDPDHVGTPPPVKPRRLATVVPSAEALEIGWLVPAAVDLGHDVVDIGSGTTAGLGVSSTMPLARRVSEQLLRPPALPVCPVPALGRRPSAAGEAASRA